MATFYILKQKHPSLMLLHLAELDTAEHEEAPFTPHAKAIVERSDELVGDIVKALPKNYDLALVSDHGFEQIDHIANLKVMEAADGVTGAINPSGGIVTTTDAIVAAWLRGQSGKGDVGREIPHDELVKYAPNLSDAVAAFEPAPHVMFGNAASGAGRTATNEKGNHGFWPTRPDYHSISPVFRQRREARKTGRDPDGDAQGSLRGSDGNRLPLNGFTARALAVPHAAPAAGRWDPPSPCRPLHPKPGYDPSSRR